MPAHNVGASPREPSGFARLAAMAKDQESICTHLMANAKYFEAQLMTLRTEHEALRRCLDRLGVLPADELEKEVKSAPPPANEATSPVWSGSGLPVDSSGVPPRPNSLTLQTEDMAATAITSSPTFSARKRSESPRAGASPMSGGFGTNGAHGGNTLINGSRSQSPTKASRGRSPNKSCERAESTDGRKSRPRSRSAARPAQTEDGDGEAAAPEGDLYELMSKLLDQGTSAAEQQRAVRAVQQLLKRSPDPPNTWSGPGTPLSAVVRAGRSDLARLLLRARANVNERDAKGVSALHVATYDGNSELCRVLLVARADVDACDRHGQTPLFFVPNRDICKLLIERRSDVTVLNRKGQSALHLAGRAGLHEVLAWLSSRVSKNLVELRDCHGATARAYAQQSGVPKPEASSPCASRGRRAGSPRMPSRGRSPQAPHQRATSPAAGAAGGAAGAANFAPSLRGGGGGNSARLAAAERAETAAAAAAQLARNDVRRGSGQLPYSSELVEGRRSLTENGAAAAAAAVAAAAGDKAADAGTADYQQAVPSQRVAQASAAVLEAAVAVGAAAVATAAELEAAQKSGQADEARAFGFDQEADKWPVQAEMDDLAELGVVEDCAGQQPVARGPGAVEPGAGGPLLPNEADLSEIRVIHEADEDLADLGVMEEGDNLFSNVLAPLAGQAGVNSTPPIKEADEEEEEDAAAAEEAPGKGQEKQEAAGRGPVPEEAAALTAAAPVTVATAAADAAASSPIFAGSTPAVVDASSQPAQQELKELEEPAAGLAAVAPVFAGSATVEQQGAGLLENEGIYQDEDDADEAVELAGVDEVPAIVVSGVDEVPAQASAPPTHQLLSRLEDELDEVF